jgi:hypothetical protein
MPTGSVISLRLVRPEAQDDFEVEYVATIETGKRDTVAAQLERDKEAADRAWHRRHTVKVSRETQP